MKIEEVIVTISAVVIFVLLFDHVLLRRNRKSAADFARTSIMSVGEKNDTFVCCLGGIVFGRTWPLSRQQGRSDNTQLKWYDFKSWGKAFKFENIASTMTRTFSSYYCFRKSVCVKGSTHEICICCVRQEMLHLFVLFISTSRMSKVKDKDKILSLCPGCVHAKAETQTQEKHIF